EGHDEEEEEDELYRDVNINQGRGMESIFKTTSQMDVQTPTSVALLPMSAPTITPSTIATITTTQQALIPPTTASSTLLQDLPNFGSLFGFDNRLKMLEANFSKFMQTDQFARAVYSILGITIDENMQKIIKEQVKEQVKVKVSKILPKIEQTVNEQPEAEVLTRSSNSSKTSYAVAADLSEMERKKILIEKIKGNKRRDDDADKDQEPFAGSDQGSKRPSESATAKELMKTTFEMEEPSHLEFEIGADDQPIIESSHHPEWFSQQKKPPTPDQLLAGPTYELMNGSCKILIELEFFLEKVYKATKDQLDWVNPKGQQYPHNLLKPLPLIPDSRGHRVIPFDHFINNDLEYLRKDLVPRTMWIQELIGYDKHALWGISHWGCKRQQFYDFAINRESARDITMRKDDDKLYKFKEGDFNRLRIQDKEDMLLLLVQGKLTNLTVEERFAFNVSLRMFTRSIVIQRRVEDLQLGVKSYQKKLNLTRPDTYRSDLKRKDAYSAYFNPRGFIYQNKDKQNRLMRIDELHKFNDGTLTDVCTALDDRLKGIRMKYLPKSIWRKSEKDRAAAMIQAIDKMLKTRRIMRSLERFVGGRLYEGDFRMLQRTI
nr:hypothetical protein [Tanacetum cinerariifolium]